MKDFSRYKNYEIISSSNLYFIFDNEDCEIMRTIITANLLCNILMNEGKN